jgi:uncharacterized protein YjbJ (UPF0337 family)
MVLDLRNDNLNTNWTELKGKLRKHWNKVTIEDMRQINGKTDELIRILRKRYGYGKTQAEFEIIHWLKDQNNHQKITDKR